MTIEARTLKASSNSLSIRAGSSDVRIYTTANRARPLFIVVWYVGEIRYRRNFRSLEIAKDEAKRIAKMLNTGRNLAANLSNADCETFISARKLTDSVQTPLLAAVEEYVACRQTLGERSLLAAVKDYMARNRGVRLGVTVTQVAKEFIEAKKQDGVSQRYIYQLQSSLNRFAAAFPIPILHVKSHQIDEWLRKTGGAPRSRNCNHTNIRTFFSWAKSRSYLPKTEVTEAELVSKVKVGDTDTQIFTKEQLVKILRAASEEMIPYLVLGAFAGLRSAEIARLDWSAIDLERRIIQIRAGQAKTASRRITPISENLRQWLLPHVGSGLVIKDRGICRNVTPLAKKCGFEWPNNGLRHSYISYRIALVKSAEQVALEAGNSPTIIFKHYRELATEEQAAEWFNIRPETE